MLPLPHRGHRWRVLVAALLCGVAAGASAVNLQVTPTTVTLSADRRAEGMKLRNSGKSPLHAQIRIFRWTQSGGEDRLEPTTDVVVSPPMLELPPAAEQLVRIVRLGPPPVTGEASYRLIVDELPLEQDAATKQQGLRLVLRYSIPVFLTPQTGPLPASVLRARLLEDARQQRFLEIENVGNGHAQIAELGYANASGTRSEIAAGLAGYVLPGQRRRWPLPANLSTAPGGSFKARINGEADERVLELDR